MVPWVAQATLLFSSFSDWPVGQGGGKGSSDSWYTDCCQCHLESDRQAYQVSWKQGLSWKA